ncbi:DUF3574 domain-containing protein [Roseomonas xinghualingensis]|uniref:DUF3574 domain-containing protein n=1 Tax=Roseomonas xinghualingensis TaxID=2986475 RepID=UPI0021F147E6|nr:DUF3574 domain-containing protein [Roseomonas sp. SXEYE001]MCV4207287.1 DUF3574 domain-containing protein [Roseomonas sp. SXEYE001]
MTPAARAAMVALALLPTACAVAPACPSGTAPAAIAELAFGRNAGGTLRVTDVDWARFLADEATPRFPSGLTILDTHGQWRGADGRIEQEPGKVIWLVLPGATLEEAAARTSTLAAAYRDRFSQESVLRVFRDGCAGF